MYFFIKLRALSKIIDFFYKFEYVAEVYYKGMVDMYFQYNKSWDQKHNILHRFYLIDKLFSLALLYNSIYC